MADVLQPASQGVIHTTPGRTRLRVPADYRDRTVMRKLEERIQQVSGVKYCETNETTGSIVVYHEEQPDILQRIGEAIQQANPQLFHLLVQKPPAKEASPSLLSAVFSGRGAFKQQAATSADAAEVVARSRQIKKMVPLAFLAAGLWQVVETESLLAGMAPLVLFYYAFDTFWKFSQEDIEQQILVEGRAKPPSGEQA